ncbi:putative Ig domain-containing protein [Mucilaginibacter myungsuensis]|uniref:Alpha-galactosidase n=1 Tax=Mucilaginibacter myungsuensis TaxID=649104 RepID=A0A929PW17_9SPHI|nr:putative Ig domain-containing protein [Mucilaginibacter myungsuensis]MBE9661611.1 putative Ig domain-containing protein [Mucilaginibacter myungsuensis]MDN3597756.1 putative Ig domain-containing protein [Mucilaginibacter myungsuensis]
MKRTLLTVAAIVCLAFNADAQISIAKGWKINIGDSPEWSSPTFNDADWKAANVSVPWEANGYPGHDGFGWYRNHVVIPTWLKEKAFLKDSLRISLANVDDRDEVFLNGKLIGRLGGAKGDIRTSGNWGPREYKISANDPAILWGKENLIAVRIFDRDGDGGMYGTNYKIGMVDITDGIAYDAGSDFWFGDKGLVGKTIKLTASNTDTFSGRLSVLLTDPETGGIISQQSADANFAKGRPFNFPFRVVAPQAKSYRLDYNFEDAKTGTTVSYTESTPYILTPPVSSKPRINGADVFAARPGNPFLYLIPATGAKPLKYKVDGLPDGLKLNPATGVITGSVPAAGTYPVTFTVSNLRGSKTKAFNIVIGNTIGLTPALGWNSWNAWGLSVDDAKVRTAAKTMTDKLAAHGWAYVNIDDGWESAARLPDGRITTNSKFPDMKALTDYVHGLGLRMGIYSSPGDATCGGYLGSLDHELQDAQTYAEWGMDYLKYDWCAYSKVAPRPDLTALKKPYYVMTEALAKLNRDILHSFCQYGMGKVWEWGAQVGGNSWRTTGDIEDTWQSMSGIGFRQDAAAPFSQPGHFNDPDMLVVGKVGWGPRLHNSRLTFDEQYTHISLWSLLASPLLIGCDMGQLDKFTLNLLTNDEVIAIDQDALGKGALPTVKNANYQIWVKELKGGAKAIGLFNMSDSYQTISLDKTSPELSGFTKFRDVWRQQYMVVSGKTLSAKVAPHGVLLLRVEK